MPKADEKKADIKIMTSPLVPTLSVDGLNLVKRSDSTYLLRWLSTMPDGIQLEHARMVLSEKCVQAVVDLLAKQSGHYPQKAEKRSGEKPDFH